jgi:hypothetical protein
MPTHYFEVNNVRTSGSTAAVGTDGVKAELSTTHNAYIQESSVTAAHKTAAVNALANAMKLYDAADITTLSGVVDDLVAANTAAAEDTAPWQQRVGKGVWQITYGYATGVNAAALTNAIAASVIIDLA